MTRLQPGPDGTPDAAEIRTELERLIASPAFTKSPQLAQFIKFVVEETLAGRGDRIKAYSIATDALGRDASFDPQNDPIVRVEAGRLRRALDHYYAAEGHHDPVVIDLPRGHYMPVFRANTAWRRAFAPIFGLRRVVDALPEKFRLVLLIVVIAAIVSVGFDLLFMHWTTAKWREMMSAAPPAAQVGAPSNPTGGVMR